MDGITFQKLREIEARFESVEVEPSKPFIDVFVHCFLYSLGRDNLCQFNQGAEKNNIGHLLVL